MFAVFAVVLALAGAPAGTPMGCYPTLPVGDHGDSVWGLTTYTSAAGPTSVALVERVCVGLAFAAADRQGRQLLTRQHPRVSIEGLFAVGLLVGLHEAEHVALGPTASECTVETVAFRKLPGLLRRFEPRAWRNALAYARGFHQSLPANYRHC